MPATLRAFQDATPALVEAAAEGDDLGPLAAPFGVECPDLETQVRIHLGVLDLALAAVERAG